jgi:hypothetical protein
MRQHLIKDNRENYDINPYKNVLLILFSIMIGIIIYTNAHVKNVSK